MALQALQTLQALRALPTLRACKPPYLSDNFSKLRDEGGGCDEDPLGLLDAAVCLRRPVPPATWPGAIYDQLTDAWASDSSTNVAQLRLHRSATYRWRGQSFATINSTES